MSIKEEMNSDIDLVPSKWSRRTVADGEWLQKNTIDKLSARDDFLADKIDGINSFTGITTDESISGDGLNNPIGIIDKPIVITAGIDLSANSGKIGINTNGTVADSAKMPFVAGSATYAAGIGAAAFGYKTSAVNNYSFAGGSGTSAVGSASHAEGADTLAVGSGSHAEGSGTSAYGTNSHAEGNQTLASGSNSHAEGYSCSAGGNNSHAAGGYSITKDANSFVCGKYNSTSANAAFVVGNGTSTATRARSDAFIVYWDGSVSATGKISANGVELGGTPNNATISLVGNGIKSSTDNSFTVNEALNKSIDISLPQVGAGSDNWTKNKDNYNPILSVTFGTSDTYKRYRCLLIAHPDNNGDGQDELVEVYLGIANTPNQLDYKRISILTNPVPTSNGSSLLNTNYYKFGYTWDDTTGTVTLWIKCNVDSSGNRRKTFFLLKANGELENVNYHPQTTTSITEPQGFTELDIVCYEQTLTAGTDLKITDNIISVNTDGTVGNSADMSFVAGSGTYATGLASFAEGVRTSAVGIASHAEGYRTRAVGNYSHAEGSGTSSVGNYSHAGGGSSIASGAYAHAEGQNTSAMGQTTHTEGYYTYASGLGIHAEGMNTIANGYASHTEGISAYAKSSAAHAEGYGTSAQANYSHAEGLYTIANTTAMHAGGKYNKTSAGALFVIGNGTSTATTDRSDAFIIFSNGGVSAALPISANGIELGGGGGGQTYYAGTDIIIENGYIKVNTNGTIGDNADKSFVAGAGTYASGEGAAAFGYSTSAKNKGAFAEGGGTSAAGLETHAEGYCTLASGDNSHAEGRYTKAGDACMHVGGKYNSTSAGAAFVIGNGTTTANRSDALIIDWDGKISAGTTINNRTISNLVSGKGITGVMTATTVGNDSNILYLI